MILLLAPGPLKYDFVKEGLNHYLKLTSKWLKVETRFPQIRGTFSSREERISAESRIMEGLIPKGSFLIILDEKGESLRTKEFANLVERQLSLGKKITFLVGGPEGISDELKKSADFLWKLSDLTLNHELVLLIIAEALFRAISILKGHPYHRD